MIFALRSTTPTRVSSADDDQSLGAVVSMLSWGIRLMVVDWLKQSPIPMFSFSLAGGPFGYR